MTIVFCSATLVCAIAPSRKWAGRKSTAQNRAIIAEAGSPIIRNQADISWRGDE